MKDRYLNKVVIIGAGSVGSTFAFTLMQSRIVQEIVIFDLNRELARGNALDMSHGLFFTGQKIIKAGDYADCRNADVVVITAGAAQKPGETRLDLVKRNSGIVAEITKNVIEFAPKDVILLMVTNPVDVLTYVALKESKLPPGQVIGSGTVLDTARLRYYLAQLCGVDTRNVHAYVIGEHGDSELVVWSRVSMGALPLGEYCQLCQNRCPPQQKELIEKDVRESAYKIIDAKGATNYAIALALKAILHAILGDENSILTVSTLISGEYGINDVCLSVPSIVNRRGVTKRLVLDLSESEMQALLRSASILKDNIGKLFVKTS